MAATRICFAAVKGKLGFGEVATKNVLSKLIFPAAAGHRTTRLYSSDKPISRFPVPEVSHLPEDIQETMKEVEEKTGFLPNVLKIMAHRPAEFRAFFAYYAALMQKEEGNLSKAEREMIVTATSAANNCMYCVVSHGAMLRIYSKNPLLGDQVATNWRVADLSERERAILEFASKVGRSDDIEEADFAPLQKHGLDREDVWDIGAIVSLFALSNRMQHMCNSRPNDEYYLMGRVPRDSEEQ